jgi:hypothetical protein
VTWLLSISAHFCIDQLRKRRLELVPLDVLPDEEAPDPGLSPEATARMQEEKQQMRKLLNKLGAQDRAAIIMRYWYDFSEVEIASALSLNHRVYSIMWVISVATMTVGNVVAISQSNIKRMLAYSSIAHAGYILVAFVAGNDLGTSGILFYLMAYAFMNLGAFTCVILLGKKGEENTLINDYAGIGFKYPLLAASMTIFLLSI